MSTFIQNGNGIDYQLCAVALHLYISIRYEHYKTYVQLQNMWSLIDDCQV